MDLLPRVPCTALVHLREIGYGAFGKVLLTRTPYGELVAVKYASQGKEGVLAHEARMQARLAHVGIARLAAVVVATCTLDPRALVVSGLVMEHCAGGSLAEWLEWNASVGGAPLPFERRLDIADQIFAALEHMHSRGVCHLDLKPCNVMLQHRDLAAAAPQQLKLIDFGLSQLDDRRFMAGRYRGTLPYMAPELARNTRSCAAPALDIWSAGVILRELVTQAPPCATWKGAAVKAALRDGSLYAAPPPCEAPWAALMGACLSYNPAARPAASVARTAIAAMRAARAAQVLPPWANAAPLPPAPRTPPCGQAAQRCATAMAAAVPPALPPRQWLQAASQRKEAGGWRGGAGGPSPPPLRLPESLGLGGDACCAAAGKERCALAAPLPLRPVAAGRELNLPESLGLTSF